MLSLLIRRKYTKVIVVAGILTVIMISFVSSRTALLSNISNSEYGKWLKNYFDNLFASFYGDNNKNKNSRLNKRADAIFNNKIKNNVEDKFFTINDHAKNYDYMTVDIPYYYYDRDKPSRPQLQPFDPRFTLGIYINHIRRTLEKNPKAPVHVSFHWYDWVDLSVLNKYLLASSSENSSCALLDSRPEEERIHAMDHDPDEPFPNPETVDPFEFCIDDDDLSPEFYKHNKLTPGFNVFRSPPKITSDIALLTGRSYLYTFAPPPALIFFLTNEGSYRVFTNDDKSKLLDSNLVDDYISHTQSKSINAVKEFKALKSSFSSNKNDVIKDYKINLRPQDFNINFDDVINDYQKKITAGETLSPTDLAYYQSLQYSKAEIQAGGPPKYFSETRLVENALGDHYDWRFYTGVLYQTYEQTLTLHRLVRTFLSFCRKNGINTWVAHGSLLSWYWNGIAFPWDNDIDVQMPINDLHKLSRDFNQTLVVENLEDGMGRYFVDCGSFITLRAKGNGNNNIDARFIDLDTGLYIDITGLAVSNSIPPSRYNIVGTSPEEIEQREKDQLPAKDWTRNNELLQLYNCRNNHFSDFSDISPLIKTSVEGEIGYVPNRFTKTLSVEYNKGLLVNKFAGHIFMPQIRLWVREEDLYYFLTDKEKWIRYNNYQEYYLNHKDDEGFNFDDSGYELTDVQRKQLKLEAEQRKANGEIVDQYGTELNKSQLDLIMNLSHDDLIEFLHKDEILVSFITSRDFTESHEKELRKLLYDKDPSLVLKIKKSPPMKLDPFLFKVYNDYLDYNDEIESYMKLLSVYEGFNA